MPARAPPQPAKVAAISAEERTPGGSRGREWPKYPPPPAIGRRQSSNGEFSRQLCSGHSPYPEGSLGPATRCGEGRFDVEYADAVVLQAADRSLARLRKSARATAAGDAEVDGIAGQMVGARGAPHPGVVLLAPAGGIHPLWARSLAATSASTARKGLARQSRAGDPSDRLPGQARHGWRGVRLPRIQRPRVPPLGSGTWGGVGRRRDCRLARAPRPSGRRSAGACRRARLASGHPAAPGTALRACCAAACSRGHRIMRSAEPLWRGLAHTPWIAQRPAGSMVRAQPSYRRRQPARAVRPSLRRRRRQVSERITDAKSACQAPGGGCRIASLS